MKTFNRRAMLSATPGIVAVAAIAAADTVADANPASDKVAGITRLPSTNNFNSLAVNPGQPSPPGHRRLARS